MAFTNFNSSFQVYGHNNNDTITTSDISAGVRYQGGHGNDHFIIGDADATFIYAGSNNSSDSFTTAGTGLGKLVALNDNTVIGLASGFNDGVVRINEIDVADFNNVRVEGTTGNDVLDFSGVAFTDFNSSFQVYGHNNNDTITTSNISAGVRYQGGHGNDHFIIGDADATFIYSGTNNSSDSFTGNDSGQTVTILALSNNTNIGLADGFENDVDLIDDGGFSGVKIFGTTGSDTLNFEEVQFAGTMLIHGHNGNDTVTATLDRGHALTYNGGYGNDTLFLSLTDAEAQDVAVQTALDDFFAVYDGSTPYTFGTDGPSSALDGITIQDFESVLIPLVVSGAGDYRVVRNDQGAGTADDEIEIYRDGNLIANQLISRTSEVRVLGATNSSDSLEVDFSGGDPVPVHNVFFNGLGGSGSDELLITNGSHTDTIYTYENAHDGSISLDGSLINYVGLEPITNTGTTTNAVFNLTEGGDVATLTDNGATSSLTGSSFENTTFTNPTGSLTINGGGGGDQFLFGGVYDVALDLVVDAETISVNHDLTVNSFTSTGNTLSSGSYDDIFAIAGDIDITTFSGKIDVRGLLDAQNGGSGSISLNAATTVYVSSSITTDGGDFTSAGTSFTVGGIISTGSGIVDLDGHSGDISLGSDVSAAAFSATGGATFSTGSGDNISVTDGNIDITTSSGKIDVRGLLSAQNSGAAAITLDAATTVYVSSSVTTDGGNFISSGTDLTVGGAITVGAGDVNLDAQTGAISLGGDVTGAAFSAIGGTMFSTGSYDDISVSSGNIDITTSSGKIEVRGHLDAQNSGTATITLHSGTTVYVSSSVTTDGGSFVSSGTDLTVGGVITVGAGDVNLDAHTGAISLGGDVTGAAFSAIGGTSFSTGTYDDIRATAGDIAITTSSGEIDVRGLLEASNSGTGTITLNSATTVNVSSSVTTDGGGFTSSGTDLLVTGAISAGTGAVNLDGHIGSISLGGDVTGASFSATGGTSLTTGTYDDIRATAGNIDITTSSGKIDLRGLLEAQNGGTGAITLNSATTVNVLSSVSTDGGDFLSSGSDLLIGSAVNTSGGNIVWDHGNVALQSDVNTGGGNFTSGNGTGDLTTGTYDDIRTAGGTATFDHKTTQVNGQVNTDGGDLNVTLHLVTANYGPTLFYVASGNLVFSNSSVLTVDASAVDLEDDAPFDQFDVIRANNGDVIESGLSIVSGQDANGDDTAFVYEVITSGSSEILRLTGAPLLPIVASGAGDYVLQLEDLGTASTNDDEIVLYRDGAEIDRRAYFATSYVDITGAMGTSDSLTIDFDGGLPVVPGLGSDGGNPIPIDGVTFDGLGGAGSDTLILEGGTFDAVTFNYDNANDGDIELVDGAVTSSVNFLGLDPIVDTTTAAVKTFNLLGGNDSVSLSRVDATTSVLSGATIENTTFTNPTDSLVITGGSGTDTISVTGANLDLGTAGIDLSAETINIQAGLTAASVATSGVNLNANSGKDITSTEGDITFTQSGYISAGGSDLSAANSTDDAAITLVAGSGGHDIAVRSVTTDGGNFTSTGGRHLNVNSDILTGGGLVDLNHTNGNVTLYGDVTASAFQSDGVNLSISSNHDIHVSGVLGSGEGIDINHTGAVSMGGTDLISDAAGASIIINAGSGGHDVTVRSVTTSNGDFISTANRHFTANSFINTGSGLVDLNHTNGNVSLYGDVTASTFQSDGVNLSVSSNHDIHVSDILGSGEGIDINHTGAVSMGGTDLISDAAGASIIINAGSGSHDVTVRSVKTIDGDFVSTGNRHFTANSFINTGTGLVDLNHTNGNVSLYGDVTASTFQSDGVNLSVSSNHDIHVSDILGSGEGIDINHTGAVSMGGTDLISDAAGASIIINAGSGSHDVTVRSVKTIDGDFVSIGNRHFTANSFINTGTGLVDLNHTNGSVSLYGDVTASTFQSDGVNLSVSSNHDIHVSDILGTGEGIDINHTGAVSMGGTDLISDAAGASIIIKAGSGSHDVSVRSVTTSNGDFISTANRHFTAFSNINTGTGIVDLNHGGGNITLYGNVNAGAYEASGANFSMSSNHDIVVSGNISGYGISAIHSGSISLGGTDLVSTGTLGSINLQAGGGSHDIVLRSATTSDGSILISGGRHLTLNEDLEAGGTGAVNLVQGGTLNLGNHDITSSSSVSISAAAINGGSSSLISSGTDLTLISGNNIDVGDVISGGVFNASATTMTLYGTLDFGDTMGFIYGNLVVASSGELVFDLFYDNAFQMLIVTGDLTLIAGNTVTVDVGYDYSLSEGLGLLPLAQTFGDETGSVSHVQKQGDPAELAKIDDVFSNPDGIFASI
ncbi:hypothetical protein [Gimesia sp.]|uniref:hypothetical protein n=1 Tax=Gimesia sp. TaxID=2024833 RepID=UPI003A8C91E2